MLKDWRKWVNTENGLAPIIGVIAGVVLAFVITAGLALSKKVHLPAFLSTIISTSQNTKTGLPTTFSTQSNASSQTNITSAPIGLTTFNPNNGDTNSIQIAWLDNARDQIRQSQWLISHKYGDCAKTNVDGFWPTSTDDCNFSDQTAGPNATDQAIVADPPNLYYKHFLPDDGISYGRAIVKPNNASEGNSSKLATLKAVIKSPEAFKTLSIDSLYIALDGGVNGTKVKALSLMVHSIGERPISLKMTSRERAKTLYQPFIEGAIGQTVSTDDVEALYVAARDRCGGNALKNDQSGRGLKKEFGDYVAVVQWWESDLPKEINDCNIHVVKKS